MTATPRKSRNKTRRTRLGCVCKLLCGVILLLLFTIGGAYVWLSGGKWQPLPEFHESWTPEERAALIQFDTYLTAGGLKEELRTAQKGFDMSLSLIREILTGETPVEDTWDGVCDECALLVGENAMGKPMHRELAEIVKSGSAARKPLSIPRTELYDTPARLALYTGHAETAKALVKHGADTNFYCEANKESLLSCLLGNRSLKGAHPLSLKERLSLADWLVEQGADVHRLRESLQFCRILSPKDGDVILRWLFAHGFGTEPFENGNPVYQFLHIPEDMAFWKEMFASGKLSLNAADGNKTPLQVLCKEISSKEHADMLEWMLRNGASPNISAQQEGLFPQEQPLEFLIDRFKYSEDDDEETPHLFRAIRLLRQYGAALPGSPLPRTDNMHEFRMQLREKQQKRRSVE